ncbi:formylglycine-generating enzyme family protein, partial [Jiangella ureilytica]
MREVKDVARGMVRLAGGGFWMGGDDPDAFPADGEGP